MEKEFELSVTYDDYYSSNRITEYYYFDTIDEADYFSWMKICALSERNASVEIKIRREKQQ